MSLSFKNTGGIVIAWACMATTGLGLLIFINDVNNDDSRRMNSEISRNILFPNLQRKTYRSLVSDIGYVCV